MPKKGFAATATGKQGRALSWGLLRWGSSVTSLARNLESASAAKLSELGVNLREGQLSYLEDVGGRWMASTRSTWLSPPGRKDLL